MIVEIVVGVVVDSGILVGSTGVLAVTTFAHLNHQLTHYVLINKKKTNRAVEGREREAERRGGIVGEIETYCSSDRCIRFM